MIVKNKLLVAFLIFVFCLSSTGFAGEQGHYSPMAVGVRDYVMPPKGFYLVSYDMYYSADTFRDSKSDRFDSLAATVSATGSLNVLGNSVPITLTGNLNANLNMDFDMFIQMMPLIWVPDFQILGADYAFLIAPSWGYSRVDVKADIGGTGTISVGNHTRTVNGSRKINIVDQNTGFGDLYVQPIWLAWRDKQYDVSVSYGIYAPTGFYDKDNLANIGMGFMTQQVQASAVYYPMENMATAIRVTPTYEWHSRKIDKAVQPGQSMTLEYGLSQYIHPRAEIAVLGYNQWQITEDTGHAVRNKNVYDTVAGIGGQITCWAVENKCAIVCKFNKEYLAKDRFEGIAWSVNVTWIF